MTTKRVTEDEIRQFAADMGVAVRRISISTVWEYNAGLGWRRMGNSNKRAFEFLLGLEGQRVSNGQ